MTQMGPGEVFEKFSGDLEDARLRRDGLRIATEGALSMAESAMQFADGVKSEFDEAEQGFDSLSSTVVGGIEATEAHPNDPDKLAAIMQVRGRTSEETASYFGHIDKINSDKQPVVVINGDPGIVAAGGLTSVTYGRTAGPRDFLGVITPRNQHGSAIFNYEERDLGTRQLDLYLEDLTGFVVDGSEDDPKELITGSQLGGGFIAVTANPYGNDGLHPFEAINFAGSAEEVEDLIEKITSQDKRLKVDGYALRHLGVPTMVAYGDEAVIAVSERFAEGKSTLQVLSKHCMDIAGIDVSKITPDFSNYELMTTGGSTLFREFDEAFKAYLSGGEDAEEAFAKLAFLGPIHRVFGYHPEYVEMIIDENVQAHYLEANPGIPREQGIPETGELRYHLRNMRGWLERVGITTSYTAEGFDVRAKTAEIRDSLIKEKLADTAPWRLLKRNKLASLLSD